MEVTWAMVDRMAVSNCAGHALSWGGAYSEIVTCLNKFWAAGFASEPGAGQLNPLLPKTYEVVKNVITEVATLFPDGLYHAGGDEINAACWLDDAAVRAYVNSSKSPSEDSALGDLLTKYIRHYLLIAVELCSSSEICLPHNSVPFRCSCGFVLCDFIMIVSKVHSLS